MLQHLPTEVLLQILSYLPTASSIINLSLTNHELHDLISADNYAVFRQFVQRSFPSIKVPPLWRDAARVLTSRSRAWDRRAIIPRECYPPGDDLQPSPYGRSWSVGYVPAIDSYESWSGSCWADRKEVLAWGAAGRLQTRVKKDGTTTWRTLRTAGDTSQHMDILDTRLLRPHQHDNADGESILFRRANGEIVKVETLPTHDSFQQTSQYLATSTEVDCMDVSNNAQPFLAVGDPNAIHLYPVHGADHDVRAVDSVSGLQASPVRQRTRCIKFLADQMLAVGIQFLQGRDCAPINVYDIGPSGLSTAPLTVVMAAPRSGHGQTGRHSANTIAALDDSTFTSAHPGRTFLSGWTDGVVRLHDMRIPHGPVAEYVDHVDDGQILSILPIGCERFLAGSHENACLKTFDLRMSGAKPYSYLDARAPVSRARVARSTDDRASDVQREINIFLALNINYGGRMWQPLSRRVQHRSERYRGSIYSLSAPSPSSPTVYVGIENHVVQLDSVSTDDFRSGIPDLVDPLLGLEEGNHILNLSCYQRPRDGHEATDSVLLRKQFDWPDGRRDSAASTRAHFPGNQIEDGWDERWHLARYEWRSVTHADWTIPPRYHLYSPQI